MDNRPPGLHNGKPENPTRRVLRRRVSPTSPPAPKDRIGTDELTRCAASWLLDSIADGHSERYIESNRFITDKLVWWCRRELIDSVGAEELRCFFVYIRTSHTLPEGRWGEKGEKNRDSRFYQAVSARTAANYHKWLRTFFEWLIKQGKLTASPFATLSAPVHRPDQVEPFTPEQIQALLSAAQRSFAPERDTALVLFFLDTGVRASELIGIEWRHVDISDPRQPSALVTGKGNKKRRVYWSRETHKALLKYVRTDGGRDEDDPLFQSVGGHNPGEAMTRWGVRDVIERLGKEAGIEGVRCSPHTLRHSHATMFLAAGGAQLSLMDNLGHTSPAMTKRYVQFSGADRANQVRQFSPVASLKKPR